MRLKRIDAGCLITFSLQLKESIADQGWSCEATIGMQRVAVKISNFQKLKIY
jgi:hypothetical protein